MLSEEEQQFVNERVAQYSGRAFTTERWEAIRRFVTETALAYFDTFDRGALFEKARPGREVSNVLWSLAWAADFQVARGRELTVEIVLDETLAPAVIAQAGVGVLFTQDCAVTYIRRVSKAQRQESRDRFPELAERRSEPPAVYGQDDLRKAKLWADSLNTPLPRQRAHLALSFMAGAGLSLAHAIRLRVSDIEVFENGDVWLNVSSIRNGRFAQRIPVAAGWREPLRLLVQDKPNDAPVFGNASLESVRESTFRCGDPQRTPNQRTLCHTWVVSLLAAGVPVTVVSAVSGIGDLERFERAAKTLRDPDELVGEFEAIISDPYQKVLGERRSPVATSEPLAEQHLLAPVIRLSSGKELSHETGSRSNTVSRLKGTPLGGKNAPESGKNVTLKLVWEGEENQ